MNPKDLPSREPWPIDLEREHRLARARLSALLEAVTDAAWIKDEKLRYVAVNAAFARMVGRPAGEILGRTDRDLFDEALAARYEREIEAALARGGSVPFVEEITDAEGRKRTVTITRSPVRDSGGALLGVVNIARDISEQRELEQRLIQSQKMEGIGRLAGGIAHDFNNMLTAIQGYSALLLTELPPGDSRREEVEEILKAGERATSLTRQLLAFSRRQVLEPRVIDLNEVVHNVSRMLGRLIGENIELSTLPGPDLWRVLADPGQIEQVVINLAINARDAMPRGGKLTIETINAELEANQWRKDFPVQPGHYVLLAISDTGTGMTPEIQAHVFEPFFTTKARGEGTGLGLATVYGIVKQSGGYIWAYSEPGNGSTFKVYLPRVEAPLTVAEPARPAAAVGGSETILLVEDEPEVRALVEKLLRLQGYRVLAAADPTEAIAAVRAHEETIHLLVTDVVLPSLSGRDLAAQIVKMRPGTPVLYVSGYTDDAIVRHGVLEPGLHFLQKPFTPAMLGKKIREILDRK